MFYTCRCVLVHMHLCPCSYNHTLIHEYNKNACNRLVDTQTHPHSAPHADKYNDTFSRAQPQSTK